MNAQLEAVPHVPSVTMEDVSPKTVAPALFQANRAAVCASAASAPWCAQQRVDEKHTVAWTSLPQNGCKTDNKGSPCSDGAGICKCADFSETAGSFQGCYCLVRLTNLRCLACIAPHPVPTTTDMLLSNLPELRCKRPVQCIQNRSRLHRCGWGGRVVFSRGHLRCGALLLANSSQLLLPAIQRVKVSCVCVGTIRHAHPFIPPRTDAAITNLCVNLGADGASKRRSRASLLPAAYVQQLEAF